MVRWTIRLRLQDDQPGLASSLCKPDVRAREANINRRVNQRNGRGKLQSVSSLECPTSARPGHETHHRVIHGHMQQSRPILLKGVSEAIKLLFRQQVFTPTSGQSTHHLSKGEWRNNYGVCVKPGTNGLTATLVDVLFDQCGAVEEQNQRRSLMICSEASTPRLGAGSNGARDDLGAAGRANPLRAAHAVMADSSLSPESLGLSVVPVDGSGDMRVGSTSSSVAEGESV